MKGKNSAPPNGAAASTALDKLFAFLHALYQKLPVIPMLDRETSAAIYAAFLLYILCTGVFFLSSSQPSLGNMVLTSSESPIAKNSQLPLLPGERYQYRVTGDFPSQQIDYQVSKPSSCAGVLVTEEANAVSEACLLADGTLSGGPAFNFSLGNSSMLIFSPWMLAVSEGFSWKVDSNLSSGSLVMNLPTTLQSQGLKSAYGRPAYKILQSSEIGGQSTMYIDKEKRVLLYMSAGNSTARITAAPFALNESQPPEN